MKEQVLARLAAARGAALSGEILAESLGVSRAAVWKAVKELQKQGYSIEAVPATGYALRPGGPVLCAEEVRAWLADPAVEVSAQSVTDSTNLTAKAMGAAGAPSGSLAVADRQTAGRGRRGRSFASPPGTGLYLSVVLRSALSMGSAALVTSAAAVAVCRAVQAVGGPALSIKWVNDLYTAQGKKCCGILTEAVADLESGGVDYLVAGMGLNLHTPAGGFPEELRDIAGAIFPEGETVDRARLAAEITNQLAALAGALPAAPFMEEYRARNIVPGRDIFIVQNGEKRPAHAEAITDDGHLLVTTAAGREELSYGEVSIRFE